MRISSQDIHSDLQRKLTSGVLRPGEKLKPAEFQREFDCSANTIRDVFLRLSRVGLVQFELQRGFWVTPVSQERRHDVTRFRILLEQEGARLSMKYGGLAWEARLSASHHKLSHIETQIVRDNAAEQQMFLWTEAELEFHETLISGCASPILCENYANIYLQFRQQFFGMQRDFGPDYFRAIISEHQAILDAALSLDVEACNAAIYNHLKRNLT